MLKQKWKKVLRGMLFSVILLAFGISAYAKEPDTTAAETKVSSYEMLKKAVEESQGETVLTVGSDIVLEEPITIKAGQNITLVDDGTARTISTDSQNKADRAFEIEAGGKFTIKTSIPGQNDLLVIDGQNFDMPGGANEKGQIITCNGQFVLEGGTIENSSCDTAWAGTIVVSGKEASFYMTGGLVRNNFYDNQYGGVIRVSCGAVFTMEGGSISENDTYPSGQVNNATVYVAAKEGNSSFQMNGGEISGNHGFFGGVFLGEWLNPDYVSIASMEMNGGKITNNKAERFGGGIMVCGQASLIMEGGEVSGNEALIGGGIAAYDLYYARGGSGNYDIETWKQFFPAEFVMNGGTISGNKAFDGDEENDGGCGGGIYIGSDSVVLNAGYITNNTAQRQGGGVYVGSVPYTLHMYNTLVTENTATILGGGLWFCPTGDAHNTVTNGGAIFGNTARAESGIETEAAGDDFAAVPQEGKEHFVTLADRMLGGGEVAWYKDGGVLSTEPDKGNVLGEPDGSARYDETNSGDRITEIKDNKDGIALKSVVSESAAQLARMEAKLFVTGNTAPRGGGIGSNGAIIIGTPQDEWSLDVIKAWADEVPEDAKKEVTVRLTIGDYELDTVTLNQTNGWKASFTQLPNPDSLSEGLTITAIEEGNEYIADYTEVSKDGENKRLELTITNHLKPSGNLTVSKEVIEGDKEKEFPFTVVLGDTTINGIYNDMEFKDGIAQFTLKDGESKTAIGLPAGITYTVEEQENEEYTVTKDGDTGIIPKGDTAYALFKNKRIHGTDTPGENPEEPKESLKSTDKTNSPKTGDDFGVYIALAVTAASICLIAGSLYIRKKKQL